IGKFNEQCRQNIFTYEKEWERYVHRFGRWVDFENSYKTMDNTYIESEWWAFSELVKKELVYKGVRVSQYCPRCATAISNQEVSMGEYVEQKDPALTVTFPFVDDEKTAFLAWTTTPWTLPANTGLTVNANLEYVGVKPKDSTMTYVVVEARVAHYFGEDPSAYEIVWKKKGSELVGQRYVPVLEIKKPEGDAYRVVAGEHVTDTDGTGIVHTAPAFGEEDFQMHQKHQLPILMTVDDEGNFDADMGAFAGIAINDAHGVVIDALKTADRLFKKESILHNVATCWRCTTRLMFKAQPAWYVDINKLRPTMIKAAEGINWHPEHFKEGRFGKGLETAPDWNISRTRYWGSPIPVWETEDGERVVISSIEELKKRAKPGTMPEKLDLHRPMIDEVIVLTDSGKEAKRIPEVFDTWFDSGSMPFASIHYPFQHAKTFESGFPADFIGEAQDQTRGWFYSLHVLSSALFGKPAFKNVICTGLVLAEDGKKMSKSLKNYPDPWEVFETHGVDAVRYYLTTSPVVEAESLNFSERDLQTIVRGFLNLFWNIKTFYLTFAEDTDVKLDKPKSAHVLDRWILSRLNQLTAEMTEAFDAYDLVKAGRPLRFFVEDLSTWWLRRSRDRMKSENAYEKLDALKTLLEVLLETSKLMAPFTPFIAEKVYLEVGGKLASVHLEKWPKADDRVIDERLMLDMQWVRDAASRAHELRSQAKLPVRQALASLTIKVKDAEEAARLMRQTDLLGILAEETNVEVARVESDNAIDTAWTLELDTVITPELKKKGMKREFIRNVMNLRKEGGFVPTDLAIVEWDFSGEAKEVIEAEKESLLKELRAKEVSFVADLEGEEAQVGDDKGKIRLSK
ncbi:MAG: isoleucine--tRNA ligase, partial [Candidatus Magasanikbacteria bacterium]|nr:isoleucine--tRNA ligase [Candidatus Magasanikbacteria bacterium]